MAAKPWATQDMIGKRVELRPAHVHAGRKGVVRGIETTFWGAEGLVVDLDFESMGAPAQGCYVFVRRQVKFL